MFFDLRGNMVYSVKKEIDFGTNFAEGGAGDYKDTGLGRAFRQAMAEPDKSHYIDWDAYEASGYGADAAFFSTGIRNASGHMVGVYAIRLPPGYEQSVDKTYEDCSLEAMSASYEGAINIAGLGRPVDEDMEKPLPCFKGQGAKSFYFELDGYLRDGFPGVPNSAVPDPYKLIRGNAADATCLVAFTLRHFLNKGHAIEELQNPTEVMYNAIQEYIKNTAFQGTSGPVAFDGTNNRANNLVVQQVQQGVYVEVGLVSVAGNMTWMQGGVASSAWQMEDIQPAAPKAEDFNLFTEVVLPFFFVIIPVLLLLALSPLLCLVVIWIFKTCAGRVGTDGGDSGGSRA
jgi:hypothetical protein